MLDVNIAESVFTLFFLFARDPALKMSEQPPLDEILHEIFQGHSIPKTARKRLTSLYSEVISNPPLFSDSVEQIVKDLYKKKETLISFIRILLRLISDDGMISKRHSEDLKFLIQRCGLNCLDMEEFTEEEQSMLGFVLSDIADVSRIHTAPLYLLLGCEPDSPLEEVKKAYRSLAMKYHPDRAKGRVSKSNHETSTKKFQEIQLAYASLMNILNKQK
jgi:hypothetical protein